MTSLFVYGSLRRGQSNHHELERARFIREARTAETYSLVRIGDYPALVAGAESIVGELYTVDESLFGQLDAFEGEAYTRSMIELEDGRQVLAYRLRAPQGDEEAWPGF